MFVNFFHKSPKKGPPKIDLNSPVSREEIARKFFKKPHLASGTSNGVKPELSARKVSHDGRSITLPESSEFKLSIRPMPATPVVGSKPLLNFQYKTNFAAELLGRRKSTDQKSQEGCSYSRTAPVEPQSPMASYKFMEKWNAEKEKQKEKSGFERQGAHCGKNSIFEGKRPSSGSIAASISSHNDEVIRFKRRASNEPNASDNLVLQAQLNHVEKVVELLNLYPKTINPNATGKGGQTPIYFAVQNGNTAMLLALLEKSANPNQISKLPDKMTPLMIAAKQ